MKKIGVLVLICMLIGPGVFASDGTFSSVPGEELTGREMAETEGDGFITMLLGGAAFGSLTYLADCMSRSVAPTWSGALASASVGAIAAISPVVGALAGLGVGTGTTFRVGTHYLQHEL